MPDKPPPTEPKVFASFAEGRLKPSSAFAPRPRAAALRSTMQQAQDYHDLLMQAIDRKYTDRLKHAETQWENAEFDFEEMRAALNRLPDYWEPPYSWLYWLIIVSLGAAMKPIIRPSVELFLADNVLLSTAPAAIVSLALVTFAHWIGLLLRRAAYYCMGPLDAVGAVVSLAALAGLVLALCYGAAVLGQGYADFKKGAPAALSVLLRGPEGLERATEIVLSSRLAMEGGLMFGLSLSIVGIGVLFSFFRHDPHPNYEALERARRSAHSRFNDLQSRHANESAAEDRRFAAEIRRKNW